MKIGKASKVEVTLHSSKGTTTQVIGYLPDGISAVAVLKLGKFWTIRHIPSGLSVGSLLPSKIENTKESLVRFLQDLKNLYPDGFDTLERIRDNNNVSQQDWEKLRELRRIGTTYERT